MLHNFLHNELYFKISSFSTVFSNSFASISINFTKLEKGLQPILESLGQFFSQK
jgi:hypothetical protein